MNIPQLIGEEWAAVLPKAEELLTPIYEQLKLELQHGMKILPEKDRVFRVFRETGPSKIRVIFLGQDPYHNPEGQATGRAFECGKYPSASWRKIAEVYKREVISPDPRVIQGSLDTWAGQGVFLINKALTVRYKMPNSHTRFWEPFTHYAIGTALTDFNPKAIILLGAGAQRMVPRVAAPHKNFIYEHPAAASYQQRPWHGDGVFKAVDQFLEFHDKKIEW